MLVRREDGGGGCKRRRGRISNCGISDLKFKGIAVGGGD
jgi:hypothetical protein